MLNELIQIEKKIADEDFDTAIKQIISLRNKIKLLWILTNNIDESKKKIKNMDKDFLYSEVLLLKNSIYNLNVFANKNLIKFNLKLLDEILLRINHSK